MEAAFDAGKAIIEQEWHMAEFCIGKECTCKEVRLPYREFNGWMEGFTKEDYEPYIGWCDVDGCGNEASSGGGCWRESGYWKVCRKHDADFRNGLPQPKMKKSAIERESKRDPVTGYMKY